MYGYKICNFNTLQAKVAHGSHMHKPIGIYMRGLILGVNTYYTNLCLFWKIAVAWKVVNTVHVHVQMYECPIMLYILRSVAYEVPII